VIFRAANVDVYGTKEDSMKAHRGSTLVLVGLVLVLSGLAGPVLTPPKAQATTTGCANFSGGDLFGCQLSGGGPTATGWSVVTSNGSTNASAVFANNNATSGTTFGLRAQSNSPDGVAVRAYNGASSGTAYGLSAQTLSTSGVAVNGVSTATSGAGIGVRGESGSPSGTGVYGIITSTGSASGTAPAGVYGRTGTLNGSGVFGIGSNAISSYGVQGQGFYGVFGYASSSNGTGVYGAISSGGTGYAGYFDGKVHVNGTLSKSAGSFKIDHPLDPANKYLSHSFVESPDMMNIYNGNVTTDAKGDAMVTLPDYFEALNGEFRYQLTVIGTFAQAIVASEIKGNQFTIKTDKPNVKVSWQVTGIRHDPYAEQNRIPVEEDKPAKERGTYLYPQGYGQPETKGRDYEEIHRAQLRGQAAPSVAATP
jgi:hypothetical protein